MSELRRCSGCGAETADHLMAQDLCPGCYVESGTMAADFKSFGNEARAEHHRTGHQRPHGGCDICFPHLIQERVANG